VFLAVSTEVFGIGKRLGFVLTWKDANYISILCPLESLLKIPKWVSGSP
jgi:hypothetical protein